MTEVEKMSELHCKTANFHFEPCNVKKNLHYVSTVEIFNVKDVCHMFLLSGQIQTVPQQHE